MEPTSSNIHDPRYLHVPFHKRWECHRDTIQKLYIDDGLSIENIALKMKDEYSFDASARQYKYHIKKWGFSKNISTTAKKQVVKALEKRQRKGAAVGDIRYKGESVDKKKIRRHLKALPQDEPKLSRDAMVFARWDFPYQALKTAYCAPNHPSPAGTDGSTPSAISMSGLSPSTARSPINAPTPTTVAIRAKTMNSRAASLLDGRYGDFLKNMSVKDRKISIAWLDQFWYFSFKTFKHWGKGPRHWTAGMLQFGDLLNIASLPNTPGDITGTLGYSPGMDGTFGNVHGSLLPSNLCRWSIHLSFEAIIYDEDLPPSPPSEPTDHYDINDPDSWPAWPKESPPANPTMRLSEALHTNEFSSIKADDLPLSSTQVAKAAVQSPEELLVESLGFAIMARNADLVREMLEHNSQSSTFKLEKLYPFHLAASYLDGSKSCCGIMHILLRKTTAHNRIGNLFFNNLGHTVLDSLMMTILKGHSSCLPEVVDDEFRGLQQFVGGEVDPCGRWDADSACIRQRDASSRDHIPQSWKHMFCHTSVQAICHSIMNIYTSPGAPGIQCPSGLFVKSCGNCGDRLVPLPLHTLVLTTFYLAQNSCEGETLFGALACLVCLLVNGADPHEEADMSIEALLGADNGERCTHEDLDPLELAKCVPLQITMHWSKEVQLGWDVFLNVLQLSQLSAWTEEELDEDLAASRDCYHYNEAANVPLRPIGVLWAIIQTELLTYRRLDEGAPWVSENCSMESIMEYLRGGLDIATLPLIDRQMMKQHCKCGRFFAEVDEDYYEDLPTTKETCAVFFSNLEDWNRSSFLGMESSMC